MGNGSMIYSMVPNDTQIGAYTIIEPNIQIGKRVRIGDFVRLCSGTILEDDVFIDSYVCSSGDNLIGKGTIVRYGAILALDVQIGERAFLAPRVTFLRPHERSDHPITEIGDDVMIGAGAVIDGGVRIADGVKIGALSFVRHSCLTKGGLYVGSPARPKFGNGVEKENTDCSGVDSCVGGQCVFNLSDSGKC